LGERRAKLAASSEQQQASQFGRRLANGHLAPAARPVRFFGRLNERDKNRNGNNRRSTDDGYLSRRSSAASLGSFRRAGGGGGGGRGSAIGAASERMAARPLPVGPLAGGQLAVSIRLKCLKFGQLAARWRRSAPLCSALLAPFINFNNPPAGRPDGNGNQLNWPAASQSQQVGVSAAGRLARRFRPPVCAQSRMFAGSAQIWPACWRASAALQPQATPLSGASFEAEQSNCRRRARR